MSSRVSIFEVGPRDGLQNESHKFTFADKIWLVKGLVGAGLRDLELGAFVRPDKVPQMADSERVLASIDRANYRGIRTWSLVPNRKGLARAIAAGAKNVAVFTAATDGFAKRNIGMSVKESLREYGAVIREARGAGLVVRGYVSTAFGCPFEGKVKPSQALRVIHALAELGVAQISIGDTIGVATPGGVDAVVDPAFRALGRDRVAVHFHDTRGTALANTLRSLEIGIRTVDSSAGGLGGCPFAPGATGNLATEDLVYMLDGMGIKSGVNLPQLCKVSLGFAKRIRRPLTSRYLQAFASGRR